MALDKQIIRENATTAVLIAGGGAQELQDKMIGISTDDESIIFRISSSFFQTVNTAGTWTDESIPYADANNRMVEDTDFFYSQSNERLSVKNIQLTTDFIHIGDDDTKFTFPAADQMRIDVGGVVFWNFVEDATDYCEFNSGEVDIDFIVNGDTGELLFCDAANHRVGINTNAPSRTFQVEINDAVTNAVTYLQRITHFTTGTAAAGFGAGLEFVLEADDGNADIDGTIECVLTDATGGAVESALTFSTIDEGDDGLVERVRIDKDGNFMVGTNAATRRFQVDLTDAATNTTTYMQRLTHFTSGTAAANFGAGLEFVLEAADGAIDIDGTIECILTDATGGAVESALLFKTIDEGDDGLAERVRIDKDGNLAVGTNTALGKLHVVGTAVGAYTPIASGDDLIIENTTTAGMSFITNDFGLNYIYFGTDSDPDNGSLSYFPITSTMTFACDGVSRAAFGPTKNEFNPTKLDVDFQVKGDNEDYAFFVEGSSDRVGVGVAAPAQKVEILKAGAAQLRLTETAAVDFCDFEVDGSGGLNIAPSGDNVTIGDGGTTNYCEIKSDGEINLHGTAMVTKKHIVANAALGKGASAPTEVIIGNFTAWEFGLNDDAVMTWAVPKDWAPGTDIIVNVSWYCDEAYATNSGEVRFQMDWAMCPHDNTEAVDAPTHSGTDDSGDIDIPATAKYMREDTVATIAAASIAVGDEMGMTLTRIALVGGSNPTALPGVIHLEIMYTSDRLGTAT